MCNINKSFMDVLSIAINSFIVMNYMQKEKLLQIYPLRIH
jgi:hypothetical protein